MSLIGFQTQASSFPGLEIGKSGSQDAVGMEQGGFGRLLKKNMHSDLNTSSKYVGVKQSKYTDVQEASKMSSNSGKKVSASQSTKTTEQEKKQNVQFTIASVLSEMGEQVKQMVMNQFQMTEEEFEQVLENLGISVMDLLVPNQLTNFFFEMNQVSDSSLLLTDEVLQNSLGDLLGKLDQILTKENEIEVSKEEILEALENLNQDEFEMNENVLELSESTLKTEETTDETREAFVKEVVTDNTPEIHNDTKENNTASGGRSEHSKQKTEDIKFSVNGSVEVTTEVKTEFYDKLASTSESKVIVEQIVKEIKVSVTPEHTSMEMVLTPETLGRVNLHVSANNGVMTAHMITETEVAKQAIENQLVILKETLESQGLKIDSVDVTVATNSFDFLNQSHTGNSEHEATARENFRKANRKLRMTEDIFEDESSETVTDSINISIGKGTQIDMLA